jgi:glycosyltransferase involved in cell wall biosynthesis
MYQIALLASHPPQKDPRCGWFAKAAPASFLVQQFGVARTSQELLMHKPEQGLHTVPRMQLLGEEALQAFLSESRAPEEGIQELLNCHRLSTQSLQSLAFVLDTCPSDRRLGHFIGSMQHFTATAVSLINAASQSKSIDGIIACDLDTLIPAIILKSFFKCPLIYDAHEFWAHADIDQADFEKEFWISLEARLLRHVDIAVSVSPPLSEIMSDEYGVPFETLPNAEPLDSLPSSQVSHTPADPCIFLFQGGFAKGRGIDLLIEAWPQKQIVNEVLLLRGPNNAYKHEMIHLAKRRGLLDKTIFFPDAVEESELIRAAQSASVGIIPYTPTGINYKYCCPNKLSQYMAAGLPILANNTEYVSRVVSDSGAGEVVDFEMRESLTKTIAELATNVQKRQHYARNSYNYFRDAFNWNKFAEPFYCSFEKLLESWNRNLMVGTWRCEVLGLKLIQQSQKTSFQSPQVNIVTKIFARFALFLWLNIPVHLKSRMNEEIYKVRWYAHRIISER